MTDTPTDRLYRIVEQGMCIGCGLCETIAGADRVQVRTVTNGNERPVITGDLDHATVDRIYAACPGTRLDGLPPDLIDAATRHDLVWGPYQRMIRASAADPDVRHIAATGGVLTALCQYLVDSGRVTFVHHAKADAAQPTHGRPQISENSGDVLNSAGSIYGPTAILRTIGASLDLGVPFAFVGKPCDISALRNYAHQDPRVSKLVRYWLTPVCGGYMPPEAMDRFLRDDGTDPEDVSAFRYRGYGCPGPTRYETKDGRVRSFRYTEFWGTDETQWLLPFRCKVCPDGIGEGADIAASDTWPGGSPDPATEDDDLGTNAVIVRTAAGMDLIEGAVAAGYLDVEAEVDPRYMDSVQPHQRHKKLVVRRRWDGLADAGRIVPQSAGLRVDELAAQLDPADAARQRQGTYDRVQAGKADEPRPVAKD